MKTITTTLLAIMATASVAFAATLYIDNNDIPQSLLELKNPYDTGARSQAQQLSGDKYRWDVAYFDGHYYVYFGNQYVISMRFVYTCICIRYIRFVRHSKSIRSLGDSSGFLSYQC